MTPFAAVLLAGGQSRRMGRDKALLKLPDGRALWECQWETLCALSPAERFVSGAWREGMPRDLPWLPDPTPGCGPLGGIAAALDQMQSSRLVVLAVDLPAMTSGFLDSLVRAGGKCLVPQWVSGFFEPLAAVYPKAAADTAWEALQGGQLALQPFVRALIAEGRAVARLLRENETCLFVNWNQPGDLLL